MDPELELSYLEVVDKPERRFGYRDLPETARVTFSSARQGDDESVDDWADRVMTLASEAYMDLPEAYMLQESILGFCMGVREKEAGELVINQSSAYIEQAIDQLKWVIHTRFVYHSILVQKVECVGLVKVAGVSVASESRLVERVERNENTLGGKMDVCMGMLDQLLARPNRSSSPSPVRQQCFNCKEIGHLPQELTNCIQNDNGLPVIIEQIKSDLMSRINASVNGFAIHAVIDTAAENALASDRIVAQLPKKVPMLEQVLELTVLRTHRASIDVVGAALGLSGQVVSMAQDRGLGKGKIMLRGSLWRVVMKAVSDFRFIQEWLMHGTDPLGHFCAFMIARDGVI
ncbi:hypothetical protein DPMN_141989 [Dreissena polymorpha]|uniref:Uncharacterized protein n=1 Tax=Dreissena polymorpha TaxID=45954 RepID=A0A9D4JLS7_DREPO|nr:hypothetical protein DPMN_141989 [Dreissena polymorpha]